MFLMSTFLGDKGSATRDLLQFDCHFPTHGRQLKTRNCMGYFRHNINQQ